MVPVGARAIGVQSTDSNGAGIAARLLGAHGIRLWQVFNPHEARANYHQRIARIADCFRCHDLTSLGAPSNERTRARASAEVRALGGPCAAKREGVVALPASGE